MSRNWFVVRVVLPLVMLVAGCGTNGVGSTANPARVGIETEERTFNAFAASRMTWGTGCAFLHSTPVRYNLRSDHWGSWKGVDLRPQCPPVYNQGATNACTAYAVAKGLGEYLAIRKRAPVSLSARTLYYLARTPEFVPEVYRGQFKPSEDCGSTTTWAMAAMARYGAPPATFFEEVDPLKTRLPSGERDRTFCREFMSVMPSREAITAGWPFRLTGSYQNSGDLDGKRLLDLKAIIGQLDRGIPVVFGMLTYSGFYREELVNGRTGDLLPPVEGETFRGGHCVLAVGYDPQREVIICRNSYGTKWGDKGYFHLSYDYFKGYDKTVDNAFVYDAWSVTGVQ